MYIITFWYYWNCKEKDYAIVVAGWQVQLVLDEEMDDPSTVSSFWNRISNKKIIGFPRTSRQQKLLSVSAVQETGIIAMGITGTKVAKGAADIILHQL